MVYEDLKILAKSYRPAEPQELPKLAARYNRRQEREVLELAALASDISADDVVDIGLEPESNPQLRKAFELQYENPEEIIDSIRNATEEQLKGYVNAVKGKYFEVLVHNKLKAGESLGGIQLEPGQEVTLAKDLNQPGWDLRIVEKDTGEVVQNLQLKARASIYPIKESLEKHPNIKVVVTSEHGEYTAHHHNIIDSEISNEYLGETTKQQLTELSEGPLKNFADNTAEFALDAIPIFSAAVIAATEGGMVLMGRSTLTDAMHRGKGRAIRAGIYSTVGTTLALTPIGPVAVPTTMALRITEGRFRTLSAAGEHVEQKTQEIRIELERPKLGAGGVA